MAASAEYSLQTQAKIPCALAALHNFIRTHDPDDEAFEDYDFGEGSDEADHSCSPPPPPDHLGTHISPAERVRAGKHRDQIAAEMWEGYQHELWLRDEL